MTPEEREGLVARVCAGVVLVPHENSFFYVGSPTALQAYLAGLAHDRALAEARDDGLLEEGELLALLYEQGEWTPAEEGALEGLPKDIENLKVGLYQSAFRSNEAARIRAALKAAKARLAGLYSRRHARDSHTAQGFARLARQRFLFACSVRGPDMAPLFDERSYELADGGLLDEMASAWAVARLSESDYRELARTDPWRSLWSLRRAEGGKIFFRAPHEYTEEQRGLATWSVLYEQVAEHPECPPDEVVNEDDALDGWLVEQRRRRGQRDLQKRAEGLTDNEKIRGAEEMFVVVDTAEDARKVHELNSPQAAHTRRQRLETVAKRGEVQEQEFRDSQLKMRQQAAAMLKGRMGGGG